MTRKQLILVLVVLNGLGFMVQTELFGVSEEAALRSVLNSIVYGSEALFFHWLFNFGKKE